MLPAPAIAGWVSWGVRAGTIGLPWQIRGKTPNHPLLLLGLASLLGNNELKWCVWHSSCVPFRGVRVARQDGYAGWQMPGPTGWAATAA